MSIPLANPAFASLINCREVRSSASMGLAVGEAGLAVVSVAADRLQLLRLGGGGGGGWQAPLTSVDEPAVEVATAEGREHF